MNDLELNKIRKELQAINKTLIKLVAAIKSLEYERNDEPSDPSDEVDA